MNNDIAQEINNFFPEQSSTTCCDATFYVLTNCLLLTGELKREQDLMNLNEEHIKVNKQLHVSSQSPYLQVELYSKTPFLLNVPPDCMTDPPTLVPFAVPDLELTMDPAPACLAPLLAVFTYE